jgi:hypothetical protein
MFGETQRDKKREVQQHRNHEQPRGETEFFEVRHREGFYCEWDKIRRSISEYGLGRKRTDVLVHWRYTGGEQGMALKLNVAWSDSQAAGNMKPNTLAPLPALDSRAPTGS